MLFVGTRKTTVWAVTDRNSDGVADEVKAFAPSLKFKVPNGVCWTTDGFLIVVEHNRILNFPAAEFFYEGPDVAVIEVVPQGKLIPVEEESFNHGARTCRIGPDNKLYITLGQPFNVQPRDKLELYDEVRHRRHRPHEPVRRQQAARCYARGVRNSVGMDFNPKDKTLWFTDNQTDGMGDDIPTGEINRATAGPVLRLSVRSQGKTRITEIGYDKDPLPANIDQSAGDDRRARGRSRHGVLHRQAVPGKYQGGLFSRAARLVEPHQADRRAGDVHLAQGRRHADKTEVVRRRLARPTPSATAAGRSTWRCGDGSLLVSDDYAGAIYRICYAGE